MQKTEQHGAVTSLYFDEILSGWAQWMCFMADVHWDSIFCNRELFAEHLAEAEKRNARVFILGDFFDAMQGRFDPRRSMNELREEFRREDYYDYVVDQAANFLEPYAECIDVIADGNHETAVLKHANTNLADRLVHELNRRTKAGIVHGGYGGWVRLMLIYRGVTTIPGIRQSIKIKYYHGSGGEAPVTRGVIQTNRQAVYLPDADIVINGHNHQSYVVPISRERIGDKGSLYFDVAYHIRTPGYKQSYGDGSSGWDVMRGGGPKPIGCVWCKMIMDSRGYKLNITPDVMAADAVSIDPTLEEPVRELEQDGGDF